MVDVLADPRLYTVIGGEPPTRDALLARYTRQVVGRSPDGTQTWHNWIVRRREDDRAIGTVQATITDADGTADIAWLIGTSWQGRGYATEAAVELVRWLRAAGVREVTAHIDPDHLASARVAAAAGLQATDVIEDGERVWRAAGEPDQLS